MYIEFRFGPKDGTRRFLPLGKHTETIIVESENIDYLYRKTNRLSDNGYRIYQFICIIRDLVRAI